MKQRAAAKSDTGRASATLSSSGLLQRKCGCGKYNIGGGSCSECSRRQEQPQRNAAGHARDEGAVPDSVHEVLSAPGRPLDVATRSFMESRIGHDFSRVKVHTDMRAAESAQAVGALAYTVGQDVVFGAGQYAPTTREGRRTLAHELAHVVQQSPGVARLPVRIAPASDQFEQEADRVADAVTAGVPAAGGAIAHAPHGLHAQPSLQRLIRTSLVNCPGGENPFAVDRRASTLLGTAIAKITAAEGARAADPANADVVTVGNALRTIFHLDPAAESTWTEGAPQVRLPVIKRRLESAKSYIDSVVFTANCCTVGGACPMTCGTCDAGDNAFTCAGDPTAIAFCPPFWGMALNQRARTMAHEVFHITFGFILDWEQPNAHNAHCYAHFMAVLNGFNPPVGLRCN